MYVHGEAGNGQYEVVLGPKDPLDACDDYLISKDVIGTNLKFNY